MSTKKVKKERFLRRQARQLAKNRREKPSQRPYSNKEKTNWN